MNISSGFVSIVTNLSLKKEHVHALVKECISHGAKTTSVVYQISFILIGAKVHFLKERRSKSYMLEF